MPQARRVALMLIHGMGEQKPYDLTDSFVTGLVDRLEAGGTVVSLDHNVEPQDGDERGVRSFIRIRRADNQPFVPGGGIPGPNPVDYIDVHEVYWANKVRGLARLRAVLTWLGLTSLSPLAWRRQAIVMAPLTKAKWHLVLREAGRALMLPVVAALIIGLFAYAATQRSRLAEAGDEFQTLAETVPNVWSALLGGLGVLLAALAAITLIGGLWRKGNPLKNQARTHYRKWMIHSRVIGLIAAALAALTFALADIRYDDAWSGAWQTVSNRGLIVTLIAVAVLIPLTKFFNGSVGDVMIYVEGADDRSEFHDTRKAILGEAVDRLAQLLALTVPDSEGDNAQTPDYDAVYVAAHSLGSVIAYDAINEILVFRDTFGKGAHREDHRPEAGPGTTAAFERLAGFLSFGSPLDKIHYFFRYKVKTTQAIRSQLLENLLRFRMKPSNRFYPESLKLSSPGRGHRTEPGGFVWWNAYNFFDPLGNALDFYKVDKEVRIKPNKVVGGNIATGAGDGSVGRFTIKGHTLYWKNKHFFDTALELLSQPVITRARLTQPDDNVRINISCTGFSANKGYEVYLEGRKEPLGIGHVLDDGRIEAALSLESIELPIKLWVVDVHTGRKTKQVELFGLRVDTHAVHRLIEGIESLIDENSAIPVGEVREHTPALKGYATAELHEALSDLNRSHPGSLVIDLSDDGRVSLKLPAQDIFALIADD